MLGLGWRTKNEYKVTIKGYEYSNAVILERVTNFIGIYRIQMEKEK